MNNLQSWFNLLKGEGGYTIYEFFSLKTVEVVIYSHDRVTDGCIMILFLCTKEKRVLFS